MVNIPTIAGVFIGQPRNHASAGETEWVTSIFREAVHGEVFCTRTGLEGDQVTDRRVHGGPEKAVLCYAISHYPKWRTELHLPMEAGGFGENMAVDGLDESNVCVGDVYAIGEVEVQVSQPRGPCATLARRWARPDLVKIVCGNHRSGWYLRVLREGKLQAGDKMELRRRPQPSWTIARAAQVNYSPDRQLSELRELIDLPELSMDWKCDLRIKLQAMTAPHS